MPANKIQPPFLKTGDEVALISPSSCITESILIEAVEFLERWGLRVRIGNNASRKKGPFAGTDEERLSDLIEMTNDTEIKAVFCSRGGYGLSKIINRVDFSVLRKNPKWYVGFSDITILHMWLSEVYGIMSVHGEMPLNFNNKEKSAETFITLKKVLFGNFDQLEWEGDFYKPADISGEMTGGNLSLLYSLSGTKAAPSTKGKILFIEEVGEYYYHIDRMLTSLKLSGKLEGLAALVTGGMSNIMEAKVPWSKDVEETILGIVSEYNYPILFNFPAGHIADNRAFYIGKEARIDLKANKAILSYI